MLRQIENDLFGIASRLKSIDRDYKVFFNCKKKRFEIHNTRQCGNTLSLVVPFNELDSRTVELVRHTSSSRMEEILAEIQISNSKLDRNIETAAKEKAFATVL